ncbi:MAG: hypothetical protein FJY88_00630 [Candidatus Eisenbacteria bacterium]|nr:hypothetical protein [Candidatus Eisenbacteria bacterium]
MRAIHSDPASRTISTPRLKGAPAERRPCSAAFTLVELMIGIFLALVVALAAGAVYLGVAQSFKTGSKKLRSQQDASLLSTSISRQIRVGSAYQIYNVPNRTVPADSGDGLAVLDGTGAVLSRMEWSPSLNTMVDAAGNRITALTLQNMRFARDPAVAQTVRFRFAADDQIGGRVEVRSTAHLRN